MQSRFFSRTLRKHRLAVLLAACSAPWLVNVGATPSREHLPALYRLEPMWQVSLEEPGRRGVIYRQAVCDDGATYLTDSTGRVVAVNSDGQLYFDLVLDPEALDTIAASCTADGDLLISNGQELTRLRFDGRSLSVVERWPMTAFVLARRASDILALGYASAQEPVIWQVMAASQEPRVFASLRDVARGSDLPSAQLTWNSVRNRAVYMPSGGAEAHAFAHDGSPAGLFPRPDWSALTRPPSHLMASPGPQDRVLALKALPDGRYLSFAVKHRELGSTGVGSSLVLEVLDEYLQRVGSVENGDGYGHPIGISKGGDVFLAQITPKSSTLTRAKLTERMSQ